VAKLFITILLWGWGQRYSHPDHAAKLAARGQQAVDCRSCHQLAPGSFAPLAVGRQDHHPCVDCHIGAEFARGDRCLTCHSSIRTMKPGKPWFPPFRKTDEFHVAFAHAKHVALTAKNGDCGGCHGATGGKAATGHPACARCHANGTLPDMNFCGGCHKPGAAPSAEAGNDFAAPSAFRVAAFSHARHQQASKAACTSCHATPEADGERPPMKQCESCHDGKNAFDARGNHCGRCHKTTEELPATRGEPTTFSHANHRARGVKLEECTQCHGVGGDWRATLPGQREHRPCQNEACHAKEFDGKIGSRLCLSCHERNDPFEPNPVKRPTSRARPEWTVKMTHGPHLGVSTLSCAGCHPSILDPIATIGDGHILCGKCHLKKAKPGMDACLACHSTVAAKNIGAWSVGARFRHDQNHREKCESCHRAPAAAPDLTQPKMEGCGACHDGARAFKVTGFGCARCHAKPIGKEERT
jgi:c(7)-type cytochrome triheme protein